MALPAVILLVFTSSGLLISRNWRLSIGLLATQYLGVFVLVSLSWPIELAVIKLITGWIAGAVLGLMLASINYERIPRDSWPAGNLFKLLAVLLTLIAGWSIIPELQTWIIGVSFEQMAGTVILVFLGLLQLSLTIQSTQVILGLLTFLAGFEIVYAAVESSILLVGLLALVNLSLALLGAYLISITHPEIEV